MKMIKTLLYLSLSLALADGLQKKTYTALAKIRNLILFLFLPNTYGVTTTPQAKNQSSGLSFGSAIRTILG
jgi:hypothetical protein